MIIMYDIAFMAMYWIVSCMICLAGGISLMSPYLWIEMFRGTKSLLLQLPMSNLAIAAFAPTWAEYQHPIAAIVYVIMFDLTALCMHRIFHMFPSVYRSVHQRHHETRYVSPFSATVLDFKEHIFVGIVPTLLPLYFAPMSELGWAVMNALIFLHGLFIHSNVHSPLEMLGCIGTVEHATHHIRPDTNFGFMIPWDSMVHPITEESLFHRIRMHYV